MNARTIDDATGQFAREKLMLQWSPEQISGHATISPETVYQHVYADKRAGGLLWKNLHCHKRRKKRCHSALGNLAPIVYEKQFAAKQPAEMSEVIFDHYTVRIVSKQFRSV